MIKKTKSHNGHNRTSIEEMLRCSSSFLSRFIPRGRKAVSKIVLMIIIMIGILGLFPTPYTFAENASIPFNTENTKTDDLELGDSKTVQVGSNGEKVVTIESLQSFWGGIFGWTPHSAKRKNFASNKGAR